MNKLKCAFVCSAVFGALFHIVSYAQSMGSQNSLITFCRTPASVMSGSGAKSLSDSTIFICDNGQKGTLNELLGKGWRLHSLIPSLAEDPRTASIFTLAVLTK